SEKRKIEKAKKWNGDQASLRGRKSKKSFTPFPLSRFLDFRFCDPLFAFPLSRFPLFLSMSFSSQFLQEVQEVTKLLKADDIERVVEILANVRERGGRLFILGVGGSAANASHAVNDFRKICGFECYAPTDNVSELTARTNDEGWSTIFSEWLKGSRLGARDGLLIFSVGGGNLEKNVSPNLVSALQLAQQIGASVVGIVGRDGGYTA